ncbi:hypothetical protein [Prosthecochloris sp.]|uniref:hypothetical protein n=1 Tax=Prosthecochloris sp. TaxID=290513 RepID=UPI0025F30A10|nr:hypothetical protein [Prosthecochloris sp.]
MDKAILSAAVALLIFTLTQLFLHLRSRQTLLREKLESLFIVMNETSQSIGLIIKGIMFEDNAKIEEGFDGVEKSTYDARPHFLLYFPLFTEVWIKNIIEPVIELADQVNSLSANETEKREQILEQLNTLTVHIRYIQNMMARNQDLTTETLRFHYDRIFRKRIPLNMPAKPDELGTRQEAEQKQT